MLQCDFAYMISPEMFERFVVPDIAACCDHLDCGFYHLDGPGQIPHVDLLCDIPRLRGIQWLPGDGNPTPEHWPELLAHIRQRGRLVQVFVSAQGALDIVRQLGGVGFMLSIGDQMEAGEARAFLKQIDAENRRNRVF
jgi:5-methyltetrahydrofolate--homocysteine methyltransferase